MYISTCVCTCIFYLAFVDSRCLLFCLRICCCLCCCLEDEVYVSDNNKRQEYVLNETGLIWAGTHNSTFTWPWNFAQVHTRAVYILYLLFY